MTYESTSKFKKIVIIAGPNGAGKTTFAQEYLPREADCPEFINVDLIFLSLPTVEIAIARVASRVAQGGHFVAEDVIRRRFDSGLRNFHNIYSRVVDSWVLYDNSGLTPHLISFGDNS